MNELMTLRTISYLMVTLALGVFVLLRMGRRWPQNRFLKQLAVGIVATNHWVVETIDMHMNVSNISAAKRKTEIPVSNFIRERGLFDNLV